MPEKLEAFLKGKKWRQMKKSDWAALALVGVLLLILAMPTEENDASGDTASEDTAAAAETTQKSGADYAEYLEEKLEALLEEMDGVGKVRVMITLADSGESVVEKDASETGETVTETDSDGGSRTTSQKESAESTVYVENGSETYPYVAKETLPGVEGVVVVAEGGGSSRVVSDISDAVMALFQVEAHKIKVVKMSAMED